MVSHRAFTAAVHCQGRHFIAPLRSDEEYPSLCWFQSSSVSLLLPRLFGARPSLGWGPFSCRLQQKWHRAAQCQGRLFGPHHFAFPVGGDQESDQRLADDLYCCPLNLSS